MPVAVNQKIRIHILRLTGLLLSGAVGLVDELKLVLGWSLFTLW